MPIAGVHSVEKSFIPRLGVLRLVGRDNPLKGLIFTVKLEDMGVLCYTESVDCVSLSTPGVRYQSQQGHNNYVHFCA